MSKVITIKKGLNIQLAGKAERIITKASQTGAVALKPTDFTGLTPKLSVKQGDEVKVGTPIFFNKYNPQIKFTSPVSGKVSAINRGDRRKILEIVIEPDGKNESLDFIKASPAELSREQIINTLLESGLWPLLRQRPYSTIAKPEHSPKAIFISAFDTAPLAPDYAFIAKEEAQLFQLGLDAIAKLTDGKVYLNIPAESSESDVFQNAKNVEITQFKGKHPTGNVGVQIHYLTPINKGETVWYINPADLIIIGRLFATGKLDFSRTIAVTGSEVKQPRYVKTILGASVKTVTSDNIKEGNVRYISGNVLTGTQVILHGYVGFYDYQLTAIPEGDYYEFLGWGTPGFGKYSMSRAFFSTTKTRV